jgi:excisionase family DNA binding protein
MMRKKKEEVTPRQEDKVLDVNASMQGTLRFDDPVNLRINGKFEGALDTRGNLMVGQSADIKANIKGDTISVAGTINGNIKASVLIKLEATAKLTGDVEAPKISISEGAVMNGRVNMPAESSAKRSSRGEWMTLEQLAKYLEVDNSKVKEWVSSGFLPGTREGEEWIFDRIKVDQWISEGKVKV